MTPFLGPGCGQQYTWSSPCWNRCQSKYLWNNKSEEILDKMAPSTTKIQPYKSCPIKVHRTAQCAVSFGRSTILVVHYMGVVWAHSIRGYFASAQYHTMQPNTRCIWTKCTWWARKQTLLSKWAYNKGCKNSLTLQDSETWKTTRSNVDPSVKPKVMPERPTPYHLTKRVQDLINSMLAEDIKWVRTGVRTGSFDLSRHHSTQVKQWH